MIVEIDNFNNLLIDPTENVILVLKGQELFVALSGARRPFGGPKREGNSVPRENLSSVVQELKTLVLEQKTLINFPNFPIKTLKRFPKLSFQFNKSKMRY